MIDGLHILPILRINTSALEYRRRIIILRDIHEHPSHLASIFTIIIIDRGHGARRRTLCQVAQLFLVRPQRSDSENLRFM